MTNFIRNFIREASSLAPSATSPVAACRCGAPCDVMMGEIGEPQREIEAPAPVRTPIHTPTRAPEPAPERQPEQEPVPA